MASSEPSFERSPPVGLPAGFVLWSSASRLAMGAERAIVAPATSEAAGSAEHERRHLLGHEVVVAVRRVDEGGLDVVLRPAGIGQGDDVRGDGDALARGHDRLDEAVQLHVGTDLRVVADVRHPDRAHTAHRDLVDVLPVDVGGAVQVDGRDGGAAGVDAVERGADDLSHRVRAVVVDPPERAVHPRRDDAGGLLDAAVGRGVGARRRPRRAREAAGRDGRRAGRGRRGARGRGRRGGRGRLVAAGGRRRDAGGDREEGEEPSGERGGGERGSGGHEASMLCPSRPWDGTHAGHPPVRGRRTLPFATHRAGTLTERAAGRAGGVAGRRGRGPAAAPRPGHAPWLLARDRVAGETGPRQDPLGRRRGRRPRHAPGAYGGFRRGIVSPARRGRARIRFGYATVWRQGESGGSWDGYGAADERAPLPVHGRSHRTPCGPSGLERPRSAMSERRERMARAAGSGDR